MNEFSEAMPQDISSDQHGCFTGCPYPKEVYQFSTIDFAQIFSALPDPVFINRLSDDRCIEVNQAFLKATGYARDEVIGQLISEIGFALLCKAPMGSDQCRSESENYHNQEVEFYRKTGERRIGLLSTEVIALAGHPCVINVIRDVTDRKYVEEKLQHLVMHDALTGVPNRSHFMERLDQTLHYKQVGSNCLVAVCFLDLDGFKAINDTFGHAMGDQLLIAVGQRLSDISQQKYFVARWGGDEFVLLLEQLQDLSDVTYLANCIIEAFRSPFFLDGEAISCSVSIGISLIPEAAITADELLQQADTALYQAKAFGKSRYHLFSIEPQVKHLPHEEQYSAMLAQRIRSRLRHNQNQ